MLIFKQIVDFYINTSIHVAVAVFCFVQITKLLLNITIDFNLESFVFFGTILGYNFLKYFVVYRNSIYTFKNHKSIVIISLTAIFTMLYLFFRLAINIQIAFLGIGILVLIYPLIRKFASLKMAFVSITITLITLYIPAINQDFSISNHLQRFLIVFCLLIPLEICDIETDSKTIATLPQIIGVFQTKLLAYFALVYLCFLNFSIINIVFAISTAVFIYYAKETRSKYYCTFWVESLPIIWFVMIYLFKMPMLVLQP